MNEFNMNESKVNNTNQKQTRSQNMKQNNYNPNKFVFIIEYGQLLMNGREIVQKHTIIGLE